MTETRKICFTCGKNDGTRFYSVLKVDNDHISFWDKLKYCVTEELIQNDIMEMCFLCITHLQISYKFRQTVLMTQEDLRKSAIIKDEDVYVDEVKSESESDTDSKNEDYSSDNKTVKRKRVKSDIQLNCDFCGSLFGKQWQLRKHLSRVHYDVRKYVCTYCNKEFKQSNHLKEHITSHTGEKNYTCPICDKKFQRLSSQRRHIKSHDAPPGHKTKRTPFLCTICGKSFPFSNGVQRHMRIHLGIKKFECGTCNRKFTQSTHLQVHMRTHTGEKPYICDTCGEKFSLKACMLKHINNRHYSSKSLVEKLPIFYLHKDFEQH